jgi:type III pantothenate kinase
VILLVDVGNTRIKWAAWSSGTLAPQRAAEYSGWTRQDWQRELFAEGPYERVVAACVAGDPGRRALEAAARDAGAGHVEFVASTAAAAGVRNAYPEPRLLGVDRWVAIVGAWSLTGSACCVVDVGTAATIDGLDASGRHLGGYIVPGPRLMVRSLLTGTSDLAAHTAASGNDASATLATNTRDAIERGCRVALAALVDHACADVAARAATTPRLLVTGGAAAEIAPYVKARVESIPDLVLHGLARMARDGA